MKLLSAGSAAADFWCGFAVVVLFAVGLLAWEWAFGTKRRK